MQEVNVRVAVRVRPLLPKEKLAGETSCVRIISSSNQLVLGKDKAFTFDHVLSSKSSQDEVYSKCVENLVNSSFDGYNATVFAYGQTGSGKTHTIGGLNITSQTEEDFGVIPRAVKQMFEIMKANSSRCYAVKVSYIEIYKEELQDLLDLDTSSKDMHIREDDKGNTLVIGASELECESVEEVMACLEQGSLYRHTGSTQMNEQSSRSHTIFTIFIEQRWTDGEPVSSRLRRRSEDLDAMSNNGDVHHYICSKFHFVDLAGSERAHRTKNFGDRFKESVHINSGLLSLGNVISALGETKKKVTHIPYRDSKITRLLKDSLGGNAKTLMITCISPAASSFDESLNALKYANRAKNIKNKPIINRDPQSIRFEEMQSEIKALREELQRQRTSMMTAQSETPDLLQRSLAPSTQMKTWEDKVSRLQTECSHYRTIAEEAYKHLTDILQRDVLSQSMNVRLTDWLELMEEIKNRVPATLNQKGWENQTINRLQEQLNQCKSDLANDEEIFAEKVKEVNSLREQVARLESQLDTQSSQLEESIERQTKTEEKLVQQQVTIQELHERLKEREKEVEELEGIQKELEMSTGHNIQSSGPISRRAKSVPASMLTERSARKEATRNIHTSPAVISLERVMAGFRARSQLLVSRLEDSDDVCIPEFSDSSDSTENPSPQPGQFGRNQGARGTYRVAKPRIRSPPRTSADKKTEDDLMATDDEKLLLRRSLERVKLSNTIIKGGKGIVAAEIENNRITASMLKSQSDSQKKRLKDVELEVRQSTQVLRDLSINIKMKEQLIKELVKTGKEANVMNRQYEDKIKGLERERFQAKQELAQIQRAYQELEHKEKQDLAEKEKLQTEFRKKMELAKTRLHSLQKKQKDTEKMVNITSVNGKRVQDLEGAVDKMRQQQELLQRKLKEEQEKKMKLEREMQKEQQKIKELEKKTEQQAKVLKVKTEEMVAVHKRLRSASQISSDDNRLEEQKKWLDGEIEKVLLQRQEMEQLEKDLERREHIILKKEAMLAEKSELEMKKLRSSQVLSKDIMTVSTKLESIDRRIEEKAKEISATPRDEQGRLKEELRSLQQGRDKLRKQKAVLDSKLQDGATLTPQEQRRLIEMDEALETLDAAIEYKNESIQNRQHNLRKSVLLSQSENNVMHKLNSLTVVETKALLHRYFGKVIDLKENDRKKDLLCSELEMKVEELETVIKELETSFHRSTMESDRKMTHQQQEYEKKIQVLMRQLSETATGFAAGDGMEIGNSTSGEKDAKIHQLEKDLFYYKKTSRDLKKKLRELLASNPTPTPHNDDGTNHVDDQMNVFATPRDIGSTPRDGHSHRSTPSSRKDSINSTKSSTPRSTRHKSQERRGTEELPKLTPARGSISQDKLGPMRDGLTPVRISRKDLRRMSDEELNMRKSAVTHDATLTDSLDADGSKNPWT